MNPRLILILLVSIGINSLSCQKKAVPEALSNNKTTFYVENFRKNGMTDQQVIQAACDSVPENSTLIFENKTYLIDHTIFVYKSLNFNGPAILKREKQYNYQLALPASSQSNILTLNTTKGLQVGDYFLLTNGAKDALSTTSMNLITAIDSNTITTYYRLGNFLNGTSSFNSGTLLFKDVKLFWVTDKNPGVFPTQSCSFTNLTFDGNRDENDGSYSWLLNYGLFASSIGKTIINGCTFMNSPAETIVGHNLYISNSTFKDINGSAIHLAIDRYYVNEEDIHSEFINNLFENTNEIPTKIGGHSEGCITHSNSGGYYTAMQNSFIDVGAAVIGLLYPSVSTHDWGTSDILFTHNLIKTPGRLVYSFGILPGKLENVRIIDNDIYELNPWDWTNAINYYSPGVELENKVNK